MRVLLGMSGGLDSAYSAIRLRDAGYTVEGAVLRMHEYTDLSGAKLAAEELCIPLHTIDCRERFEATVVADFLHEYPRGRTPNPCVVCNGEVKIAALCEFAEKNGFDKVATGHYAKITRVGERYAVARADCLEKDQSYMLRRLSQKQLSMLIFPLGDITKDEVRERARGAGLSAAEARESQEICFIPDGDYVSFIEKRLGKSFPEGNFINRAGEVIGRHNGIISYTVGQRKHLGTSFGETMFVLSTDASTNTVVLGPAGSEYSDKLYVSEMTYMGEEGCTDGEQCFVKLRYAAKPIKCTVRDADGRCEVLLEAPARAVTPGQSAVFYNDEGAVLFGGVID